MADIIPAMEAIGDIPAMAGAIVAMVGVTADSLEWWAVSHSLAAEDIDSINGWAAAKHR